VAQVSGSVAPVLFSLNGGNFQADNTFNGLTAGTYYLTATDANGCSASEIIFINAPVPVNVELGDNLFIELGEGVTLNALVNLPFDSLASISWFPPDSAECPNCLERPVAPLITTTYSISIIAGNGCKDEDDVTVFVDRRKHVYVPNVFSPNGDGSNEVFHIFSKPGVVKNVKSFLIFSRWGELVSKHENFLPNNPAFGWDGKFDGKPMDPAVFVWFAEIEFVDRQTVLFEGGVKLMR